MFISSYDSVDFTSSTLGDLRLGRRLECYGLLNINLYLLYFSRVIIKKEKSKLVKYEIICFFYKQGNIQ